MSIEIKQFTSETLKEMSSVVIGRMNDEGALNPTFSVEEGVWDYLAELGLDTNPMPMLVLIQNQEVGVLPDEVDLDLRDDEHTIMEDVLMKLVVRVFAVYVKQRMESQTSTDSAPDSSDGFI